MAEEIFFLESSPPPEIAAIMVADVVDDESIYSDRINQYQANLI